MSDHDDRERLSRLLAMLPWEHNAQGPWPPNALRQLVFGVDADSAPGDDATTDDRWTPLTNVAHEFGQRLDAPDNTSGRAFLLLAMRVLDVFEPYDAALAEVIGTLLPVKTAGRLWVEDVVNTAWRIVAAEHGADRLAAVRYHHGQTRSVIQKVDLGVAAQQPRLGRVGFLSQKLDQP
ncbi:hypothetical protein ACWEFJ_39020, partial [Actinosynnema sp. NPDC004786]